MPLGAALDEFVIECVKTLKIGFQTRPNC